MNQPRIVTRKRNEMLDAGKTFACLAVVLIHCAFPGKIGILFRTLSKFAVPFFFAISGYYNKGKVIKKIKHIGKICVSAELFYLIFDWFIGIFESNSIIIDSFQYGDLTLGTIFRTIVFNAPFTRPHLWFLYALLYCYLMSVGMRRINNKIKLIFSLTLIILFTITSEFAGVLGINNRLDIKLPTGEIAGSYIYNLFLLRAYPFFAFGELLREYEAKVIDLFTEKALICYVCLGSILAIVERLLLTESQFYLGTYLCTMGLFLFCVKYGGHSLQGNSWKCIARFGRESSMYVYILHIAVYDLIVLLFSYVTVGKVTGIIQSLEVLLTIVITCLLAIAIRFVNHRKKFCTVHQLKN